MTSAIRRRLAGEGGMTLVELMVAILILAVVLSALASTLITTGTAIVRTEKVTGAQQVASSVLEELQALDWESLGHTSADLAAVGRSADFEGEPYVVTVPSAPAAVAAEEPVLLDGVTYTVEHHVTWANDSTAAAGANQNGDYKRLTAVVRYDVYGNTGSYRLQATRAPAPIDVLRNFAVDTFDVVPDTLEYASDGTPSSSTLTVTAVFSMPADTAPVLTWSEDGGVTEHPAATMTSVDGGFTWSGLVDTTDAVAPTPRRFENDGAVLFKVRGSHQSTLDAEAEVTLEVREQGAPPVIALEGVSVRQYSTKPDGSVNKEIADPVCLKNGAPALPAVIETQVRGLGSTDEGRVGITWVDDTSTVRPTSATDPSGFQVLTTTYDRSSETGDSSFFRLTITNVDESYGFVPGEQINLRVHIDDDGDGAFEAGETIWNTGTAVNLHTRNPC